MRTVKRTNWNSGNIGLDFRRGPTELDLSPYSIFVGSIRSPETRKKYIQRMGYFFEGYSLTTSMDYTRSTQKMK